MTQRDVTLDTAKDLISGQRAEEYGDATESFTRLAHIWTGVLGVEVAPEKVALLLAGLKLSRLAATPAHADSWVDLAGYAALGSEVAQKVAKVPERSGYPPVKIGDEVHSREILKPSDGFEDAGIVINLTNERITIRSATGSLISVHLGAVYAVNGKPWKWVPND